MKITAILASHNRRDSTLECLSSYYAQDVPQGVELHAVLVDDGSTDGTTEAVRELFPAVQLLDGDGQLFWAAAMARAESAALAGRPDYLLWLNDDVVLDFDAVSTLIRVAADREDDCVVVGALRDVSTGELTYSGVRRNGWHPLRMEFVPPGDEPIVVDTFNGNVVLVSRASSARIGPIDGAFAHGAADFDYGLRATRLRIPNLLAPRMVGNCSRTHGVRPWLDPSRSLRGRLSGLIGPKGFPLRSTTRYFRRHGGVLWWVFVISPYPRAVAQTVLAGVVRPTDGRGVGSGLDDDPNGNPRGSTLPVRPVPSRSPD